MAAHELATNAVKYGAFASDDRHARGHLDARRRRRSTCVWRETRARPSTPPAERRGFGTTVLETMVGRSLGAEVERIVHDDGIEWSFAIPLAALDPITAPGRGRRGRAGRRAAWPRPAEK